MQGLTRNVRDLSPIEHARDVIQRRISRRQKSIKFPVTVGNPQLNVWTAIIV